VDYCVRAAQCHPRSAWMAGVWRARTAGGRGGRLHVLWWRAHCQMFSLGCYGDFFKCCGRVIFVFQKRGLRGKTEFMITHGGIVFLPAILIYLQGQTIVCWGICPLDVDHCTMHRCVGICSCASCILPSGNPCKLVCYYPLTDCRYPLFAGSDPPCCCFGCCCPLFGPPFLPCPELFWGI
jgi:hypothetical protein